MTASYLIEKNGYLHRVVEAILKVVGKDGGLT